MEVKPNSSVANVKTTPRQATRPRISRRGLIGRLSATTGLCINGRLLTQKVSQSASLNSTSWGARLRSLTTWPGTPRLRHENDKHDLVSNHCAWHLGCDGGGGNSTAARSRKARAGFQPNDWGRVGGGSE